MRKQVTFFLIIMAFLGCDSKVNYEKPENLISKKKMTDLLYDMHLAIGTSNVQNVKYEKNRNYMALVYEKYGIDSVQFAMSNIYYTSNIDEYEEIFEAVQERLKKLQDSLVEEADSLVRAKRAPNLVDKPHDSIPQ